MWEATTPSAETCSGLVPCSLFRLLTQAMCIPLQRKKGKRVKKVLSGSSFSSEAFVGAGGRWVPSAGWALPGLSAISQDGKAKILSLPASGGERNLP